MLHVPRALVGVLLCSVVTVLLAGVLYSAAQADDSNGWLGQAAPVATKVVDLTEGISPQGGNSDCTPFWYAPPFPQAQSSVCVYDSPLGNVGGGMVYVSQSIRTRLEGPLYSDAVLPTPSNTAMMLLRSGGYALGNELGFYNSLNRSSLKKINDVVSPYFQVTQEPDYWLTNPLTGKKLIVNANALAYSANMLWLVVDSPVYGLLRIDMSDMSIKPFAQSLEKYDFYGPSDARLTITNDGNYAAVSLITGNGGGYGPSINVYDLSTCNGRLAEQESVEASCHYKNVWSGEQVGGVFSDAGIGSQLPTAGSPVRLRFVDDNNLTFNATYNRESSSRFDAATFVATVNGAPVHKLGLLGMGDSYISGQGEFAYRLGTDTSNNPCHLSELAYPFLLGTSFDTHNSVACSGAVTNDVLADDAKYSGQVKDKIKMSDRQDKQQILSQFLPGYLNQNQFAATYTPQAVLLSIGGNNIGFSDI